MPTLSIMYGYMGAGKTTFARKLAKETNGVMFSHDHWMSHFYGVNPAQDQFSDCCHRVEKMQWELAELFLLRGVDVILDWGFWSRSSRDYARDFAKRIKIDICIYHLDVDDREQKRRVLGRTDRKESGQLWIDENAYESLKIQFEPLGLDEIVINIKG